jgi:hypothetical protein
LKNAPTAGWQRASNVHREADSPGRGPTAASPPERRAERRKDPSRSHGRSAACRAARWSGIRSPGTRPRYLPPAEAAVACPRIPPGWRRGGGRDPPGRRCSPPRAGPRGLGGVVRIRVVAEGVDDRVQPGVFPVRCPELAHEPGRVVMGGGRADHVDVRAHGVQAAPAGREQLLVGARAAVTGPERGRVRLVPDHDVTEGDPQHDVAQERAVLPTALRVERRVRLSPEDADHDSLPALHQHRRAVEVDPDVRRPGLPPSPGDRQANGPEAEVAVLRDEAVGPRKPLRVVVVDADHERPRLDRRGTSRSRAPQGKPGRRQDDRSEKHALPHARTHPLTCRSRRSTRKARRDISLERG